MGEVLVCTAVGASLRGDTPSVLLKPTARRQLRFLSRSNVTLHGVDAGDHSIDVLVGFALESAWEPGSPSDSGVVVIPARPGRTWLGLQMARPQEWILAYRLMGRTERAEALRRRLNP